MSVYDNPVYFPRFWDGPSYFQQLTQSLFQVKSAAS